MKHAHLQRKRSHRAKRKARETRVNVQEVRDNIRWEREADLVAAAVVGGAIDQGGRLTAAPSARASVPGSPGAPLAAPVQRRLERGFGAHLGAVRVHTDAAAADAARDRDARAFAAGPDVYLDLPASELAGERGFLLLAHEIAHVLQQTGHSDADGHIHATARRDTGAVQRSPNLADDMKAAKALDDKPPLLADLKAKYVKSHPSDAALNKAISEIETILPSGDFTAATAAQKALIVGKITAATFTKLARHIQGFLLDCVKAVGEHEEAAKVFDLEKREIPARFFSFGFYDNYRKKPRDLTWIPRRVTALASFSDFFPGNLLDAYRFFLYSMLRGPVAIQGNEEKVLNTAVKMTDEIRTGATPGNECDFAAMLGFFQFDQKRKALQNDLVAKVNKGLEANDQRTLLAIMMGITKELSTDAMSWLPTENDEQRALSDTFAPKLKPVAERALEYWTTVNAIRELLISGDPKAKVAAVGDHAKVLVLTSKVGAEVPGVDSALAALFGQALADPKDRTKPPAPSTITGQRKAAGAKLKTLANTLEDSLVKLVRKRGKEEIKDAGLRIGLALQLVVYSKFQLEQYKAGDDETWRPQLDYWIADRIKLSRWMESWADGFGLTSTAAAVAKFRSPTRAEIALLGEFWELSPTAEGESITDDMGNAESRGFTGTGLVWQKFEIFAQAKYYEQLTKEINELLKPPRDKDYTRHDKSVLEEAIEKAKKTPKPKRWLMHQAYWYLGEKAETAKTATKPAEPILFADLVLANKRVEEILGDDAIVATSDDVDKHKRYGTDTIFVWNIPNISDLVTELQKNTALDARVRAYYKVLNGVDAPSPMEPYTWLKTLGALTKSLRAAGLGDPDKKIPADPAQLKDQEAIAADLAGRITGRRDTALTIAEEAGRRATTHQRRVDEETIFRPQLNAFDRYDLSRYEKSDTLSENFRIFAANVWPQGDVPLQVATLMLELAGEIMKAFGDQGGLFSTGVISFYKVITWLTPLVSGTVATWDDPAIQPDIVKQSYLLESELRLRAEALRGLLGQVTIKKGGEREGTGLLGRIEKLRSDSKMVGNAAKGTVSFPKWSSEFKVGDDHQFVYGGKSWNLKKVERDFVWYSGVPLTSLGINWKRPETAGESLLFQADGVTPLAKSSLLMTVQFTTTDTVDVYDVQIYGNSTKDLEALSEAVVVNQIAKQLEALGEAIMTVTNFVLDVLEFIPGWGQGIMALRFVQTAVEMLNSEDFTNVVKMFREDGVGAIVKLLERVASMFDIEQLLMWLLFSNMKLPFSSPPAHQPKGEQKQQIARGQGKFVAIGRVLSNVFGFGGKLVRSVERIRRRTTYPMRGLRLWVVEHPMAAMILDFIVDVALPYAELTLDLLIEHAGDNVIGDIKTTLQDSIAGGIEGILQGAADAVSELRFLELPEEIIQVETIIDFLLDLVIQRLGTKYKVALKVVREALRALNLWGKILSQIAKLLPDPNELYRKAVKDNLQPHLDNVRKTLIDEVMARFGEYDFVKKLNKQPSAPKSDPIEVDFHGEDFPESSASPADAPLGDAPIGPMPTPHGGEPLSPSVRATSEAAIGHDLGHVRLHRGGDAERVTHRYVADGVTTGSHVYLRPGLSPDGGHGGHVLRHELSHVVDQTGARPLGAGHDDHPSVGAPGRGLVWDSAAESRAESVAHGATARPPASLAAGIQPSILSAKFLADFLKELKDPSRLKKQASRMEKIGKGAAVLDDPKAKAAADALTANFSKAVDDAKVFTLQPPFDKVRAKLADYLKSKDVGASVTHAIPHLVKAAMTSVVLKKTADQPQREVPYVPPNAVDVEMTEFLYGETGLALQVKLNAVKDPELANRLVVDTSNPYKSLELIYLHIPFMQGDVGGKLLAEAVGNTFPSVTAAGEKSFLAGIAQMLIARLGPRPDIWHAKEFKFHDATKRRIDEQKGSLEKVVKAKHWPTPKQYVVTDSTKVPDDTDSSGKTVKGSSVSDIGLRLGTYATWGPKGASGSPDRDAHHITQYVFFQYLANKKLLKPFWKANQRTALGIKPGSGDVTTIEKIGSNTHKPVLVGKFEKDRGGEMATIYIARNTHRSDVHIHGETTDDDPGSKRESQGGTVHNLFRAGARKVLATIDPDALSSAAVLKQLAAAPDPEQAVQTDAGKVSPVDVNKAIFAGILYLWQQIADEMDPKLEKALKTQEVAYYNLVAERRKLTNKLTEADVVPVYGELKTRNAKVIGDDAGVK